MSVGDLIQLAVKGRISKGHLKREVKLQFKGDLTGETIELPFTVESLDDKLLITVIAEECM